ncbi:unnamed protein product [Trifolium pratense]|uniref:Uncharacterized protein n=1 Tax=Trifolium pratense TaxID=57577 RepID=A0ACB0KEK4_TRIPR|nr:unnamed protein product [Trifolium pratense]
MIPQSKARKTLRLKQRLQSDDNLIPQCSYYLLSGEKYENRLKLQCPYIFQLEKYPDFTFNGSAAIAGIILLNHEDTFVLWNPATHEFKIIPQSPAESVPPYLEPLIFIHGFGYDHIKDDFKFIRYIAFSQISEDHLELPEDVSWNEEPVWEIYSLRSNSWRKLDVHMPVHWRFRTLYMDGMCHWWSRNGNYDEHFFVSFNLNNDMFTTTTIPLDIPSNIVTDFKFKHVQRHLVVLNGSIASISYYAILLDQITFHVSILGELGVKESLTKFFVIGPLLYIDWFVGVGKNGDIFFRKRDGQLVYFDLITQKTKELGVKGKSHNYRIAIYKESLFSIERIDH